MDRKRNVVESRAKRQADRRTELIMRALGMLTRGAAPHSRRAARERIDTELRGLSAGSGTLANLRLDGSRALQLLADRYHLTNGVYLAPAYVLIRALRALDETRQSRPLMLMPRSSLSGRTYTWDDFAHLWIRANSAAVALLLVHVHRLPLASAAQAVADVLRTASYRPQKGTSGSSKGEAVQKWVRAALPRDDHRANDVRDAIANLVALTCRPATFPQVEKLTQEQLLGFLERTVAGLALPEMKTRERKTLPR